jgi:hypothetical protein
MPSPLYIRMNKSGYIPSTKLGVSNGPMVGGAVSLLLNKVPKKPVIKGGEIAMSNRPVGVITTPSLPAVSKGGDLLSSISGLTFGSNVKRNKRENIKFVF